MFVQLGAIISSWLLLQTIDAVCVALNNCNGHGRCNYITSSCVCDSGWGASTDIALYRSPDCSQRTCPAGKAWGDVPTSATKAHHLMECSNKGLCNRETGECECYSGYSGPACNRVKCPNDCSGHGLCFSMKDMAKLSRALPLGPNVVYGINNNNEAWDDESIYGCVCDSSWPVGLGSGQKQVPEWFGPDCSMKHCPGGDDPRTSWDDTDCFNVTAAGSTAVGEVGNLCHVDCSNRGRCDYSSGTCKCFGGYSGSNCGTIVPF